MLVINCQTKDYIEEMQAVSLSVAFFENIDIFKKAVVTV